MLKAGIPIFMNLLEKTSASIMNFFQPWLLDQ